MEANVNAGGAVTMVVLSATELEGIKSSINELKALIKGKAREEANSEWLESEEARKLLGVSQRTWQRYRDIRAIPFSQFGPKIYVKRADLEDFFESHLISNC